ncbi:Origin recognition complex, subunit 4 domain-containing protein [Rozella allomycis CSF55]|uniref:Origin recognition complex subunit 4 n=1 Tax=Rozella allomycis (strain CSF55) TaxID=988480 RepID=A0A075B2I9_ROZAC|nr:Origin recognition complex, subunit 4 domain-containing protein [Rozella allomycis CSF55]|eukprot:EPZ36810.1 Origin recognition complex, subunit 4 domain-containing protein [Rozella allomycis CSF55]
MTIQNVLSRLTEKQPPPVLVQLDQQQNEIYSLLKRTVQYRENNSVLLLGQRACGKSVTLAKCMNSIREEFGDDCFIHIHLNGIFLTDEKMAIKYILKQLKIADLDSVKLSANEANALFVQMLRQGSKSSTPLVFVLEEFDKFTGGKQNLLYNLFDSVQSVETPMLVIGSSCRIDVLDLLEKRVKSRFSHRIIHFYPIKESADFYYLCKSILQVEEDGCEEYNKSVEMVFNDPLFLKVIRSVFDLTKNIRLFYKIAIIAITSLNEQQPTLTSVPFFQAYTDQFKDTKSGLLESLSVLEIGLVIAIKKLEELECEHLNFESAYDEYKRFSIKSMIDCYNKAVSFKAFENLIQTELIEYTDNSKCPKEYKQIKLNLDSTQLQQVLFKLTTLPTALKRWGLSKAV